MGDREINLLYPRLKILKNGHAQAFYYDDNRVCEYCGITEWEYRMLKTNADGPLTLTKDHVIAKANGGAGGKKVWACIKCNLFKNHTFNYEEMRVIGQTIVRPLWEGIAAKMYGEY